MAPIMGEPGGGWGPRARPGSKWAAAELAESSRARLGSLAASVINFCQKLYYPLIVINLTTFGWI